VLDKLSKYTAKEKHTTNETKLAIEKTTDAAIDSWLVRVSKIIDGFTPVFDHIIIWIKKNPLK